jgi:hypothetical protein
MTTFAPTYTSRWRGKYVAGGIQHTLQLRGERGATYATMDGYKDRAREIFADLAAYLYDDFAWIQADIALTDTEEFGPGTLPTVTVPGTVDGTVLSAVQRIKGLTFSGRATGSRGRFTMFGLHFADLADGSLGGDGVIRPSEVAGIGAVVTTANTYFHAGSGALAGWHNQATYKENDHLLKLVRRGTIS